MRKATEYEFTCADGSKRYEFVDPDAGFSVLQQIERFRSMHGAVSAAPVRPDSSPEEELNAN
jgi:hypothetical protein